jgi:hypothetical protein
MTTLPDALAVTGTQDIPAVDVTVHEPSDRVSRKLPSTATGARSSSSPEVATTSTPVNAPGGTGQGEPARSTGQSGPRSTRPSSTKDPGAGAEHALRATATAAVSTSRGRMPRPSPRPPRLSTASGGEAVTLRANGDERGAPGLAYTVDP